MKVLYLSLLFCLIYLNYAEAQRRREYNNRQCYQQNGERVCCRGYGENRRCEAKDNGRENDDSDEQNGPRRIQRGRLTEEQREQFRVMHVDKNVHMNMPEALEDGLYKYGSTCKTLSFQESLQLVLRSKIFF